MTTLENQFLKVSVRTKGAELTSLLSKQTGIEHLWQADPAVWPWHGPNLFPTVGESLGKQITVNGTAYPMERHGFARKSEFTVEQNSPAQATFTLRYSPETLRIYPYKFVFGVVYTLEASSLKVTYRVLNEDDKLVYFAVGGHPAFNVPFLPGEEFADYYIEFEDDTSLDRHLLSDDGYFTGETEPVRMDGRKLHLTKDIFNEDALVFKHLQSRKVTIRSTKNPHSLSVAFAPFPYLGLWAKPAAPYVCIEPWLGCADTVGKPVSMAEKELVQRVEPGKVFEAAFTVMTNSQS
jgi:galactose mutarotase-like enzyme